MTSLIWFEYALNLSWKSTTINLLVSIYQPNAILISSKVPSVMYFFRETKKQWMVGVGSFYFGLTKTEIVMARMIHVIVRAILS